MATNSITVEELADCIKAEFLYELGKEIVKKTGVEPVELLPDAPDKEYYNTILTQYTGAVVLDSLGIPQDAFDHIFKKKGTPILGIPCYSFIILYYILGKLSRMSDK